LLGCRALLKGLDHHLCHKQQQQQQQLQCQLKEHRRAEQPAHLLSFHASPLHLLLHQMLYPLLYLRPRQPSPIRRVLLADGAGASLTKDPANTVHLSAVRRQILWPATHLVTPCSSQMLRRCV
jgi:hypothetical protein